MTRTHTKWRTTFLLLLVLVLLGAAWFIYSGYQKEQALTKDEANYRADLNMVNGGNVVAPNFTLTDETGKLVSLDSFKGKVVLLSFMDPECTDICPILSAELRQASKLLGTSNQDIEFIAVNVNQYHASLQDMMQYSTAHGLNTMPNWHFVTGSTKALQAVWKEYGIYVKPTPTGDVEHSSFLFFIDKTGHEAYVANPTSSKSAIETWAKGVDFFSTQLL